MRARLRGPENAGKAKHRSRCSTPRGVLLAEPVGFASALICLGDLVGGTGFEPVTPAV